MGILINHMNSVPECSAAQSRKPGCDSHWTERGAAWGLAQEGGLSGWTAATLLPLNCSRETPRASPDMPPAAKTDKTKGKQVYISRSFHSLCRTLWHLKCIWIGKTFLGTSILQYNPPGVKLHVSNVATFGYSHVYSMFQIKITTNNRDAWYIKGRKRSTP